MPKVDPTKDPGHQQSIEYVKQHGDQMKFETEAERKDYEKLVRANPNNVMGMPAFFPAVPIQASFSDIKAARGCKCGGCAIASDGYRCPRCGELVEEK